MAAEIAMTRAPFVPLVTTISNRVAAVRFEGRFGVLRELMVALDVVPVSRQEDVRHKILLILRDESLRLESPIAAVDLVSLSNAMTELEHEAGRYAPTPGLFNRHVEIAIRALRQTISVAPSVQGPGLDRRPVVIRDMAVPLVRPAGQLRAARQDLHRLDVLLAAHEDNVGAVLVRGRAGPARHRVDEPVRLLGEGGEQP